LPAVRALKRGNGKVAFSEGERGRAGAGEKELLGREIHPDQKRTEKQCAGLGWKRDLAGA